MGYALSPSVDDDERAEKAYEHVQRQRGGHYVSFATLHQNAEKFAPQGPIYKILWEVVQRLEAEGTIRIYWPEDVADLINNHSKVKIRKKAHGVMEDMKKNNEVLIEGQIPAQHIRKTN